MRILSRPEVFKALQFAKTLTESEAHAILQRFNQRQPALQQMIFVGFAQAIASQDEPLSHLFMDISFDIICVYQQVVGELPTKSVTPQWLHKTMAALEQDHKRQTQANANGQIDLYDAQIELLEYVGLVIEEAVGEDRQQQELGGVMYNLLFLVTRLLDKVYDHVESSQVH
ncbi:MAG: hypothetical protein RL637_1271 [Pseudomonadota bacterium]|jgi:hypothetical protein